MGFDSRLWAFTEGFRLRIVASALLGLAALVAGVFRFVFLGQALAYSIEGRPFADILAVAGAAMLCVVSRAGLDYARAAVAHETAARIQRDLRVNLFEKIADLGPAWFGSQRTAGVMLAVVDGVEQLQTFFGTFLPQLIVASIAPVVIFAVLAWWDVPTAAVMFVAALVTLAFPIMASKADEHAAIARSNAFKAFAEDFLDAIQGLPTLKAFGQSGAFGRKLADRARALSNSNSWVLARGLLTRFFTDLGTGLGASVAIVFGAWRVLQGDMPLEALIIILVAGTEIFRPLRDLRNVLHDGMFGQSAAATIHTLLEAESTAPRGRATPSAILAPALSFENVGFAYPGRVAEAHAGLNFDVRAGETVGVVGPSGAGKSTIVRLLLRQYDATAGTIRIDGHDIAALDPDVVRGMIAIVAQDTTLFDGTVADNLRLGRVDASDEDMFAAARSANAHEFITALPQGYATRLGERGSGLSGGQRQRIAIARALLRDAPILVLDEALSSVDANNEAVIQEALDRLMIGRTTIVLAHRLSSVIGADRIIVLDQGRVLDSGTHAELMARGGMYGELMASQVGRAGDVGGEVIDVDPKRVGVVAAGVTPAPLDDEAAQIGWGRTLGSLLEFVRPWRRQLAFTIACGVGRVVAYIGVGVLGATLLAAVASERPVLALAIALLVAGPLAALLHWLESWLAHDMAYKMLAEMRIALFAKLDRLAPAYLLRRSSGDLVTLATQDVETVEFFYAHTLAPAFVALVIPVAVLTMLGVVAWPLALVLLPFLAWAGLAPVFGRAKIDRLGREARDGLGMIGARLTETIQGLAELTAFQALSRRRALFVRDIASYQKVRLSLLRDGARQSAVLDAMTAFGSLAVGVTGAYLASQGWLAVEWLPLLVLVSAAAFSPVAEIAQVSRQLAETLASTRRLEVVNAEPVTILDGVEVMPTDPAVTFDRVGFTYPNRSGATLTDLNIRVAAGTTVALVGGSGAGKSTIANLLLRFWDPSSGSISLGGVDLRRIRLDDLRSHIALVAQDTYLFNDTLEANVRLAHPEASKDEVRRAIERAALATVVDRLPDGMNTIVGERGAQLSGGQRQRVSLARAFLKDAPILIMDEATSHLDTISERQIRDALDELKTNRMAIIIAHRLSTIAGADQIIVLDAGQIVENGTHNELLARRGAYASLVAHQSRAAAA